MRQIQEEEPIGTDSFNLSAVSEQFNEQSLIDTLNQWTTEVGLIQAAIALAEKNLPQFNVRIFCHENELHEYRELDKEGVSSLPDDSLFIGCLSMETEAISLGDMFTKFQLDDPLMVSLLHDVYGGRHLVPVVHGGELLAFLLVCVSNPESEDSLSQKNIDFLNKIARQLQINLYAALIAGRRQRELLRIAHYPFVLQQHKTLSGVYENLLKDLLSQIDFDGGVCYAFEEEADLLVPFCTYGLTSAPRTLRAGQGISGQAFETGKPLFVPSRELHTAYSIMEEERFITGSFISVPFGNSKEHLGVITLCRNPGNPSSFSIEHRYRLEIAAAFIASEVTNRRLFARLDESNFSVVQSLTRALEAKDSYTEGHSARVTKYSVAIGTALGYSPERMHQLRYGAMLHDIGKIGINDAIINKQSRLTDDEYMKIKKHAEIGYKILDNNPFFDDVKDYVRYHHETMDGSGYFRKKEGEYPEEAMIISCADIFDALTSDRPYRKALSLEDAFAEMRRQIGIHYTRQIYEILEEYINSGGYAKQEVS